MTVGNYRDVTITVGALLDALNSDALWSPDGRGGWLFDPRKFALIIEAWAQTNVGMSVDQVVSP